MRIDGLFRIPEVNLASLEAEIAKLNKRAAKLAVAPVTFFVHEWEEVSLTHPATGIAYTRHYALVEVKGPSPKLAGYEFVAKLEPTEAGNLVKLLPGITNIPERFYTVGMDCDHCRTQRHRKETFVVRHESGQHVLVGRNCLADFLGGKSPEHLAALAELLASLREVAEDEEQRGWGGRDFLGEPVEAFVATVAAFARCEGYVSKKQAYESDGRHGEPTSARAWWWLSPPLSEDDRRERAYLEGKGFAVEARDEEIAAKAIAWAKAVEAEPGDNFLWNMKISASLEYADGKTIGILAALVGSYLREQEKIARDAARAEAAKDKVHVGQIGVRTEFADLTIAGVRSFDGQYGVRTLITFLDPDGNVLCWWTGYQPEWVRQGDKVTVKATVKKHDAYRGEPQTLLTRVATS